MISHSKVVCAALFGGVLVATAAFAEERMSGPDLRDTVVGKKLQDVERSDHWIRIESDGSGEAGSRGHRVDLTWEIEDDGTWCRNIPKARQGKYKCQTVFRDNGVLVFRDEDGSVSSRMRVVDD
jgi:hypothetical protein